MTFPHRSLIPVLSKGTFSPDELNPLVWLDHADEGTIISSSNAVSKVNDKSGNGNSPTQGDGAAQPLTGIATINGLNALRFDGTDDFLDSNMTWLKSSTEDWTWVVVMKSSVNAQQNLIGRLRSGDEGVLFRTETTQRLNVFERTNAGAASGSATSSNNSLPINTTHIVTLQNNFSSGNMTIRIDGTLEATTAIPGNMNVDADNLFYGASAAGATPSGFFKGEIGELIIVDRAITAVEMANLENYLTNKWIGFKVPTDTFGLQFWVESSNTAATNIVQSGNSASQWIDQSGQGNDTEVQGTGSAQPGTNVATQNGHNIITFDGGDFFTLPSALHSIPNGPFTIYMVAKRDTDPGSSEQCLIDFNELNTNPGSRLFSVYTSTAGTIYFNNRTSTGGGVNLAGNTNTDFQIIRMQRSGTSQTIEVDATNVGSNTSALDAATIINAYIGIRAGTLTGLIGGIAEIIIIDRSIASAEITNFDTYLSVKWDI